MSANLADFAPWPAMNGIVGIVYCDTAADLPAVSAFSQGDLVQGSKAKDIDTGDEYMMNSGGTWIKQPSPTTTQLDLSGYYTSVQTDSAISSALSDYWTQAETTTAIGQAFGVMIAPYYTGAQTDTAIANAIAAEYSKIGTAIPNGADLHSADYDVPGFYYKVSSANTIINLPANFSGAAFTLEVRNTTTTDGTRVRHILKPAAPVSGNPVPHI